MTDPPCSPTDANMSPVDGAAPAHVERAAGAEPWLFTAA
jgi:hypothetical protein